MPTTIERSPIATIAALAAFLSEQLRQPFYQNVSPKKT